MYRDVYGSKISLPQYFKYPITMLTRSRYKCAGWFICSISEQSWYLSTGIKNGVEPLRVMEKLPPINRDGYSSLSAAIWSVVEEYRQLTHEVYIIEKENE